MRRVTVERRRRAVVRRHHLAGDAAGPEAVTRALVALHASDPASVYLSVLARSAVTTVDEVSAAMYERRRLVRWMGMRRTLFVVDRDDVPTVQAAVGTSVAAALRRRLLGRLQRNGTEPPIDGDLGSWLARVEDRVERALVQRETATGAQLSAYVPALTTRILPRTPSDRPERLTTALLTVMAADGRLVRATPTGAWTSRQHRWEPTSTWWPDGLPVLDETQAQRDLARRWLTRFGPATVEDLQWWTGWSTRTTARALTGLALRDVDLHGRPGIALADRDDADEDDDQPVLGPPVATLLPTLDPTPMGWRHRHWFLGVDPAVVFDRAGNIGPTIWWDGEIIGSWAVTPSGDLRTAIVADRGQDAYTAVDLVAERLHTQFAGTVVIPAVRTPLELDLTTGPR
jgi:hypothetical protein